MRRLIFQRDRCWFTAAGNGYCRSIETGSNDLHPCVSQKHCQPSRKNLSFHKRNGILRLTKNEESTDDKKLSAGQISRFQLRAWVWIHARNMLRQALRLSSPSSYIVISLTASLASIKSCLVTAQGKPVSCQKKEKASSKKYQINLKKIV